MSYKANFFKRNVMEVGEKKAYDYYKGKNIFIVRYGLDLLNSGIGAERFCKIPKIVRSTPDFIAINHGFAFVEVKAFKGAYLRLKLDDLEAYNFWAGVGGFVFFIWSVTNNKSCQIRYENMVKLINKNKYKTDKYPDNNKEYYLIPWEDIKPSA
jgi:hypothetical protein